MGLWNLLSRLAKPSSAPDAAAAQRAAATVSPGSPHGLGNAQPLPPLATASAPILGHLTFTVLGHAPPGAKGQALLDRAIAEFNQRFPDRLVPNTPVHLELNEEMEEPAVWIRIAYHFREGEDRMAVGKHFQQICRELDLL